MNKLNALFQDLPLGYVFIGIVFSTILGMGAHNLITQFLQPPQNTLIQNLGQYFSWILFFIHSLQTAATMVLYALISRHWKLKYFWVQVFAFAILLAVINENFLRKFLMDIIADHRNISYEFLLVAVPAYVSFIFVALIIVMQSFQNKSGWKYIIAFMLIVLGYQYIPSMMHLVLVRIFPLVPGGQLTQGPYGLNVIVAIYVTYLLPVAGMYITYLWIRESLPQRGRGLLYFLLLVGVHGQFLGIFQIVTSHGNILYRILYYGSFWWELLIVACTIVFFVERKLAAQNFFHV